jgi:hypothetical protein
MEHVMKRDWDIIRSVLEEVEAQSAEARAGSVYSIEGDQSSDERARVEHAFMLARAGYLQGIWGQDLSGTMCMGLELSWSGHDLLDTIRSATIWAKIKSTAKTKGIELTFDAVKSLAKFALDEAIKS